MTAGVFIREVDIVDAADSVVEREALVGEVDLCSITGAGALLFIELGSQRGRGTRGHGCNHLEAGLEPVGTGPASAVGLAALLSAQTY